jgi:flagellar motor switch/type III secretory pathway protein FliN
MTAGAPENGSTNLKRLENIEVQLTVEVGGTKITIGDLLNAVTADVGRARAAD